MAAKRKSGASKAKKAKKTTKKKGASGAKKKTTKKPKKSTGAKKKTGAKKTGAKKTKAAKKSAKKSAKKTSAKKKSTGGGKVKKSIYLEFVGGSSAKFWEGSVQGSEFHVRYGRIGSDGALKVKSFDSPADAQAAYVKVMDQKLKKGYGVAKKPAAKKKAAPKKAKKATKAKSSAKKKKPATPPATKKSTAYLEFVGGSSSKFWEGSVKGSELHVRYGRIGSDGAKQVKSFGSKDEAREAYDKLVHQKLKKGYALIK